MDFARKQLEKYGWSEGKGLGKSEDGISTPIKPKLKFDNSGVGHDVGEQFTNNWWEKVFNSAADNLNVDVDASQGVKIGVKDVESVEITTKNYSIKSLKKNKNLEYGSFIKTAKLTEYGTENYKVDPVVTNEPFASFKGLTDEELFEACGGRTAHKGARHGLKLSGKLSRIEKQEKILLKKMKNVSISEDNSRLEKKMKKLKKQSEATCETYTPLSDDTASSSNSPMKRKNKKRKAVSFNENITTYTIDLDTSVESELSSLRDENSNDASSAENQICPDEGIEQDSENNNNDTQDNQRAFEEARLNFSDLSKAERKKLKKKRKLAAKLNAATNMFIRNLDNNSDDYMEEEKDSVSKKRKYLEMDNTETKRGQSETEATERIKSKKNKKKRNKQRKLEERQVNSIAKSLDSFCRISDCE